MRLTVVSEGDPVRTPRGPGTVLAIQGAPGSESVTVRLANNIEVDFHTSEVRSANQPANLSDVEDFIAADAPEAVLEAIEDFLANPDASSSPPPPEGGKTRGAQTMWCACPCGSKNGCMRLSTAIAVHQPQTGSCRCAAKECPCA